MANSFSWKTKFKSIIIVDNELFSNQYNVKLFITPHTANLKEQTEYFDRLKNLFEYNTFEIAVNLEKNHLIIH